MRPITTMHELTLRIQLPATQAFREGADVLPSEQTMPVQLVSQVAWPPARTVSFVRAPFMRLALWHGARVQSGWAIPVAGKNVPHDRRSRVPEAICHGC